MTVLDEKKQNPGVGFFTLSDVDPYQKVNVKCDTKPSESISSLFVALNKKRICYGLHKPTLIYMKIK